MDGVRAIGVVIALVFAAMGCDGDRSSQSGLSQPPPDASVTASPTPSTAKAEGSAECLRAQRRAIHRLAVGEAWFYVVDEVMSSDQGRSAGSAGEWGRNLAQVRARLRPTCGSEVPAAMRDLVAASRVGASIDVVELRRLLVGLRGWASTAHPRAGEGLANGITNDIDCLRRRDRLATVTYTINTVSTARGRDAWLDLRIANHTDHDLYGGVNGSMRIVGNLPPTPRYASWGSSSADGAGANARSTSHMQLLDVQGDRFHLAPMGQLQHIRVGVWLSGPRGTLSCSFAAQRR
jgi:hypothetical protein